MIRIIFAAALFALSFAEISDAMARTCTTNCYGNSCTTTCF